MYDPTCLRNLLPPVFIRVKMPKRIIVYVASLLVHKATHDVTLFFEIILTLMKRKNNLM